TGDGHLDGPARGVVLTAAHDPGEGDAGLQGAGGPGLLQARWAEGQAARGVRRCLRLPPGLRLRGLRRLGGCHTERHEDAEYSARTAHSLPHSAPPVWRGWT